MHSNTNTRAYAHAEAKQTTKQTSELTLSTYQTGAPPASRKGSASLTNATGFEPFRNSATSLGEMQPSTVGRTLLQIHVARACVCSDPQTSSASPRDKQYRPPNSKPASTRLPALAVVRSAIMCRNIYIPGSKLMA